ncbi:RnfABCDGE type electron transport complex subunit D [Thermosulfuriphilus sp.]
MERAFFYVSISPHIRDPDTVPKIMWTVFAVLTPQLLLSAWIFGPRVLLVALVSVASCVLVEALSQRLLGRPVTVKDGSAALTGLLLAYVLPPGVPLSLPIWGSVMAIFVAKQLMGGLGYNIFNPALVARAFLAAGFPVAMTTTWLEPFAWRAHADAVSAATPLYVLKHYGAQALSERFGGFETIFKNFFLGLQPGSIGETSAALLLAGGLFLIYRRIITWHIPVAILATVALLTWIFGGDGFFKGNPLVHLLSGGLILGAFFMATDYVTSPSLPVSKIIFGIGVGALTVLIRLRGGYPEGVCYAILLMNCFVPALEEWIRPRRFAPPKVKV